MKAAKISDNLTFVSLKIRMLYNTEELAIGTAFFYKHAETIHLVTNWHNVSGRHPTSKHPLHSQGGLPDRIEVGIPVAQPAGEGLRQIGWHWPTIPLYNDSQQATWHQHPILGESVDVITIPVADIEAAIPANDESLKLDSIRLYPGLDAFVLGFPRAISGGGQFPIWKRASIATEPDIDVDNLPKFYIDTATREGMSGSPVYAQEVGTWLPEGKTDVSERVFGKGRRFIGIYSGRVGDDQFQAQLGIVWKETVIQEIITASLEKLA